MYFGVQMGHTASLPLRAAYRLELKNDINNSMLLKKTEWNKNANVEILAMESTEGFKIVARAYGWVESGERRVIPPPIYKGM